MSAMEGEMEVRPTRREPWPALWRFSVAGSQACNLLPADRGMVWQGHGLVDQNRSFRGKGRSIFPPGEILFLREVAAACFSLTSASIEQMFHIAAYDQRSGERDSRSRAELAAGR